MSKELETSLDACLDELRRGASPGECLSRYPELRSELEPLLAVASSLEEAPKSEPSAPALREALVRVGAAMPAREVRPPAPDSVWQRLRRSLVPQPALVRFAVAGLAVLTVVWLVSAASAGSTSGGFLYPIKLVTERVTFALTAQPDRRAELRLTFADRRLNELISSLQKTGKFDPELLRDALRQAELALDEARPLEDERFDFLLAKLEYFNTYQKDVLENIEPSTPSDHLPSLRKAISLCERRGRWLSDLRSSPEVRKRAERSWGPDCRCAE